MNMKTTLTSLFVLMLVLTSCSPTIQQATLPVPFTGDTATPTEKPTITSTVTATTIPSLTPTKTPAPSPTPTKTPTPTHTPIPRSIISLDNVQDLKILKTVGGTGGSDVACAHNNSTCAIIGDGHISLFDANTYKLLFQEESSGDAVVFSLDDTQIAIGLKLDKNYNMIDIIDASDGRLLQEEIQPKTVSGFCQEGYQLGRDGWFHAKFFCQDDKVRQIFANLNHGPALALNLERELAAVSAHDNVFFYSTSKFHREFELTPPENEYKEDQIRSLVMSPDGYYVAWGGPEGYLRLWSLESKTEIFASNIGQSIRGLTFSSDSKKLFVTGSGFSQVIDLDNEFTKQNLLTSPVGNAFKLAFANNNSELIVGGGAVLFQIVDWQENLSIYSQAYPEKFGRGWYSMLTDVGSDGRLATYWLDYKQKIIDLKQGELLHTVDLTDKITSLVKFSPKGQYLALGVREKDNTLELLLYSVASGNLLWKAKSSDRWVFIKNIAFSPDESLVAVSGYGGSSEIWIWETAGGTLVQKIPAHINTITSLDISSDNQKVASASEDKTLKVFNIQTGGIISSYLINTQRTPDINIAFHPDGECLALYSMDGSILQIINTKNGKLLKEIVLGPVDQDIFATDPKGILFTGDGRLLSVAANNMLYVLGLEP